METNPFRDQIAAGENFFSDGNVTEALNVFNDIIRMDPHNATALNNRGVALNCLGRYAEAEQVFNELLRINVQYPDAVYNSISNDLSAGNLDKVQESLNRYGTYLSGEQIEAITVAFQSAADDMASKDGNSIESTDVNGSYYQTQTGVNHVLGKKLFFIVGCPKSGTTWLQHIIDGHPQVLCAGESNINMIRRSIGQLRDQYNSDILKINTQYIGRKTRYGLVVDNDLDYLFLSILGLLFSNIRKDSDIECIGMKNPDHLINMEFTAKLSPNIKYVHIIRDGRDVAVSGWFHNLRTEKETLEKRFPSFSAFAENIAAAWTQDVLAARSFGRAHPRRYVELRYEDLLAQPFDTIHRLLKFLDVDPSAPMVEMCRESGSFKKLSQGRESGQEDRSSFFRKGIAGDWKHHFDRQSLDVFLHHSRGLLQKLGYE